MIQNSNTLAATGKVVVVLKGYPRLSETFIAQELLGLEQAGMQLEFVSLRHPTDLKRHPVHDEIQAPVTYLPEYLHSSPWRVIKGFATSVRLPGFFTAFKHFLKDVKRDLSRSRFRRFGQAMVLAKEWPEGGAWIYAHFLHTPADVAVYTSEILGIPWSVSAHAKDIWTSPDWNIAEKLQSAVWTVTCTQFAHNHLRELAADKSRVHLSYHGLNLERFPPIERTLSERDGSSEEKAVVILSVGRAVKKKGYDVLLRALSQLPTRLHWTFIHVGDGTEISAMKSLASELGIDKHITWEGAINQSDVLLRYQQADIFALACRVTEDGDRDGLPNVLVEAASQSLTCVSTRVSGIEELFVDQVNGLLVESENSDHFAHALCQVIESPSLRMELGKRAENRVRETLDYRTSVQQLTKLFADARGARHGH